LPAWCRGCEIGQIPPIDFTKFRSKKHRRRQHHAAFSFSLSIRGNGLNLIRLLGVVTAIVLASSAEVHAQTQPLPAATANVPSSDTTYIAPDGTAYITRVIPVPKTVSPEAQKWIARQISESDVPSTLADDRRASDQHRERLGKLALAKYPAQVAAGSIAGVPVTIVTPVKGVSPANPFVLISVHGGASEFDCCSPVESIPIASLMHVEVIAVRYRLAPEYPFPAGVDDVIAVYREVLKHHEPCEIAIYGTSAGAVMTAQVAVKLKMLGLPQPAALGIFSGFGDFTRLGDSMSFFTVLGLGGKLSPDPGLIFARRRSLTGATQLGNPLLSPQVGDLSGLPPTLLLTSTRDFFLSGTSLLDRAMLRAGDDPELVVFERLNHAFWVDPTLPESDEAYHIAVKFFQKHLKVVSSQAHAQHD
jgi:monoterpene epsilon-lactone hydrolase